MNLFDISNAGTEIPKTWVAGDYVAWRRPDLIHDYPSASYSLRYELRREGEPAEQITINSTVENNEYVFKITSVVSEDYRPGLYVYDLQVIQTSDSARITIATGEINILANKADSADDPRSHPRKMVAAILAALSERADARQLDTLAYSLGVETSVTRDAEKLYIHLNYWKAELVKANRLYAAKNGIEHSGSIKCEL